MQTNASVDFNVCLCFSLRLTTTWATPGWRSSWWPTLILLASTLTVWWDATAQRKEPARSTSAPTTSQHRQYPITSFLFTQTAEVPLSLTYNTKGDWESGRRAGKFSTFYPTSSVPVLTNCVITKRERGSQTLLLKSRFQADVRSPNTWNNVMH